MLLVSSCRCLCPIHWSQVLSWEWRCSWSSADRRCSIYIWMINNFIAYSGVAYIRGLMLVHCYWGLYDCPMPVIQPWKLWVNLIHESPWIVTTTKQNITKLWAYSIIWDVLQRKSRFHVLPISAQHWNRPRNGTNSKSLHHSTKRI